MRKTSKSCFVCDVNGNNEREERTKSIEIETRQFDKQTVHYQKAKIAVNDHSNQYSTTVTFILTYNTESFPSSYSSTASPPPEYGSSQA